MSDKSEFKAQKNKRGLIERKIKSKREYLLNYIYRLIIKIEKFKYNHCTIQFTNYKHVY